MTEDTVPTLQARMGTGGNNTPMVAYEPTQDPAGTITTKAYSVREDAKANNFSATEIEVTNALQSHQPSPQSHHAQTFIAQPPTVRRLTPTECERLQGFPDGWTAERIDETKGLIPQADSHRYKQMGNAVAVPVVEWIVDRLVTYENNH
jgi:DNA (cytosine-5)-methyltransferase 1